MDGLVARSLRLFVSPGNGTPQRPRADLCTDHTHGVELTPHPDVLSAVRRASHCWRPRSRVGLGARTSAPTSTASRGAPAPAWSGPGPCDGVAGRPDVRTYI